MAAMSPTTVGGELGGHQLPVALHEDEGDQRLEEHDRAR